MKPEHYPDGQPPRRHVDTGIRVSFIIVALTILGAWLQKPGPLPSLTQVDGQVSQYSLPPKPGQSQGELHITLAGQPKLFSIPPFSPGQQRAIVDLRRLYPSGSRLTFLVDAQTLGDSGPFASVYGVSANGQVILDAADGVRGDEDNAWWGRCAVITGGAILLLVLWMAIFFPRLSGIKFFLRRPA